MNQHIQRAIEFCGGQKALAERIGLHQSFVSQLLHEVRPVPAKWCRKIEEATGGDVTKEQLRPDIFGQPTAGEAA